MKAINKLMSINEVNLLVNSNRKLILAGNESALKQVIKGNWIGGTIPYFINENGGCFNKEDVFVTDLTDSITDIKICIYGISQLPKIVHDKFENGFTWLLVPAFSEMHTHFSTEIYSIREIYNSPVIGWITGIDLSELGKITPKIFNGQTGEMLDNSAIALHACLPVNKYARLEILNLFEQGDGTVISFNTEGFSASTCTINGKASNLADYLIENNIDTRLPLVADYAGAMINISIQSIDKEKKCVNFYAPVRKNIDYKIAKPVGDYVKEFNQILPPDNSTVIGSCNCILNYLYGELEGKKTGSFTGPITFGEIAYVLVNQTMVYLSIEDK